MECGGVVTGDWLVEGGSSEWFDYNDFVSPLFVSPSMS